MTYSQDCYACLKGNHDRHDPDFDRIPGVGGGFGCDCSGDCADRIKATAAVLTRVTRPQSQHAYRPDCPCLGCEGMREVFDRRTS